MSNLFFVDQHGGLERAENCQCPLSDYELWDGVCRLLDMEDGLLRDVGRLFHRRWAGSDMTRVDPQEEMDWRRRTMLSHVAAITSLSALTGCHHRTGYMLRSLWQDSARNFYDHLLPRWERKSQKNVGDRL